MFMIGQINFLFKYCKEYFLLQYFLFFFIIIFPQIIFYQDLWDGTIYNYAQEINEFDGARLQLYEHGWVLNYWFIFLIIKISNLLNFEYYFSYLLILSLIFFFYLKEVKKFLIKFIFKDDESIFKVLFLIAAFSIHSHYYSSIMLWHLFCQFSILFGIRYFFSKQNYKILISLFFLLISFSFKSTLLYIIVLGLFYQKNNIYNLKYLFLIFLGIIVFIFFHFYLKNFGRAENYAQLLNLFDLNNLIVILRTFLTYLTFLIPLSLLLFFYFIKFIFEKKKIKIKKIFDFLLLYRNIILLLFSAIIPYIAIGRGHVIWDVEDWSGRNAILLVLPLSIISVVIINTLKDIKFISKKISIYSFIFLMIINLSFLSKGVIFKINRIIYQTELSNKIIEYKEILINRKGVLVIVDKYNIKPIFRINEINYLLYKSIGKNNLWAIFQNEFNDSKINYPKDKKYMNIYISNFYSKKELSDQCLMVIYFTSNGFDSLKDKILNILGVNNYNIKLNYFKKKNCGKN